MTDKVTEKESQLIQLINENPDCTMTQLAGKAHVSRKTIALRIKSLKEKGIIKQDGSARSGHREIIG